MKAANLKVNGRSCPLGIEDVQPTLRWVCDGGLRQTAFLVRCADENGALLWDSGRVESSRMRCVYEGAALKSGQRVNWSVVLWDENGQPGEAESSTFEMGLLSAADWTASWIAGVDTDREERLPPDCYRKDFSLHAPVRSARLYMTACGVYTASLNGQRLPGYLAPGTTEYETRLHYQTYDVTALLQEDNRLEVSVADGWFKGKIGSSNNQYFFGRQLKLLAQLHILYADGTEGTVGTDESWRWSSDGPIRYADLKDGEVVDMRKRPSYSAFACLSDYSVRPTASQAPGISEHEAFEPKLLISPSGAKILDFGENLAGTIHVTVNAHDGQRIRLCMTETLDHGEFTDITLRQTQEGMPETRQEIVLTCREGENRYEPSFFYSGFRYALVEGLDEVDPKDFTAYAIYTDLRFTGDFSCSNEDIDRFFRNTIRSMKGNFADVPTDCPQREKSGWTGDAQVFCKTASYLADTEAFYRKWLQDVRDCQREDGRVENVCPKVRRNDERDALNGAVGWADAAVIIPYTLWRLYGEERIIWENLDLMLGWRDYMISAAADKSWYQLPEGNPLRPQLPVSPWQKYVVESRIHWGEWCEPGVNSGAELIKPKPELTAAYMHYSMGLLAEMLRAIGKTEDASLCKEYAEGARKAYNHYFVKDGHIDAPRQAPMVRALALGLLDGEAEKSVAADLNADAVRRDYHVGTGFLSTPFVLGVLAEHGYLDTAYRMLENTDAPGWLAMVKQGATSIWENYIAYDENGSPLLQSMNHYSPGAVCAFLFDSVCGIRIAGENRFGIAPQPGGTLTRAEASFDSPYGLVKSSWKKADDGYHYCISIPANTSAELRLPGKESIELLSGEHRF